MKKVMLNEMTALEVQEMLKNADQVTAIVTFARISSNGVCRPQKYSIPRFFSVTTFSHSLRFSGV